jgi:hypothetical protein
MRMMKPGRELDALIAEKVMGWDFAHNFKLCDNRAFKRCSNCLGIISEGNPLDPRCLGFPHYSTNIEAAWKVVELLQLFKIQQTDKTDGMTACVQLWQDSNGVWTIGDWQDQLFVLAEGDTAPHAICLAALKIVGEGK